MARIRLPGPVDVRQIADGDLFLQEAGTGNNFIEMNMLGQIVRTLAPAQGVSGQRP